MTKYIFVTGGVTSKIGKSILASSLGSLFQARGLKVFIQKLDPILNKNVSEVSLKQNNEKYILEDGTLTDIDLGHYERFLDNNCVKESILTLGMINQVLSDNEDKYNGNKITIAPTISTYIKNYIYNITEKYRPDVQIIDISGTVGDYDLIPFLDAIRQIELEVGKENALFIHMTYLPYITKLNEFETTPTKQSIETLIRSGITPDFVVLRSDRTIESKVKLKVSELCSLLENHVIALPDVNDIHEIPFVLYHQKMDKTMCNIFKYDNNINLTGWIDNIDNHNASKREKTVIIIGETKLGDNNHISITEALMHAGFSNNIRVKFEYVDANTINLENVTFKLIKADGIIMPKTYENNAIEGKLLAIKYAREKKLPFLGIDTGFYMALIEYAKNVLNLTDATSFEFDEKSNNIIFNKIENNNFNFIIKPHTKLSEIYKVKTAIERQLGEYNFDNKYLENYEAKEIIFSGVNPETEVVTAFELSTHPFFIGTKFHPEFKSRPNNCHPIFSSFIKAIVDKK